MTTTEAPATTTFRVALSLSGSGYGTIKVDAVTREAAAEIAIDRALASQERRAELVRLSGGPAWSQTAPARSEFAVVSIRKAPRR